MLGLKKLIGRALCLDWGDHYPVEVESLRLLSGG